MKAGKAKIKESLTLKDWIEGFKNLPQLTAKTKFKSLPKWQPR